VNTCTHTHSVGSLCVFGAGLLPVCHFYDPQALLLNFTVTLGTPNWARAFLHLFFSQIFLKTMANHTKIIRLLWFFPTEFRTAMSNPRPACGPGEGFVRPSKLFIIVYVQDNDSLSLFWSSQIRHFRCSRLYCLVGRSWQFHHRLLALQPQGVEPHQKTYRQVCKLL